MSNFSQKVSLGACSPGWPSQRCSLPASACKASPNAAPRDSLFIFMHVRTSRGHPTRVCRGRVTFLEDFGAAAPFFSIKQIPRLRRTLAGDSRTGRFRRRRAIISQKLLTGQRGINTWRGGQTKWCRIGVLRTYFLQNEFYFSPLKASVEHEDVDLAISLETNVKNIGTRSNDLKLIKSSKRSNFGSPSRIPDPEPRMFSYLGFELLKLF